MQSFTRALLLTVLLNASSMMVFTQAAKFSVNGPVLTVTLKDPEATQTVALRDRTVAEAFAATTNSDDKGKNGGHQWIDLTSLRPNLFWSIQSNSPPLPNWLPSWTGLRANVGYRYEELKRLPSFFEADLKFRSERLNTELQLQPSYELKAKRSNLLVQASRGASFVLARFSVRHGRNSARGSVSTASSSHDDLNDEFVSSAAPTAAQNNCLEFLRASYNLAFPAGSSLSSLRITPSLDVTKQEPSCILEGTTGGSSRTKAILNLNYNNPTLAVVHALDERNTISPEISLYNAKILYLWKVQLHNGASIRTKVDPTTAIDVTWTDTSAADGGRWVTDFRLPLEGTTLQALASDVRVRRQFNF